jgi:succinoglycan biosynthesis transport protein ExoP
MSTPEHVLAPYVLHRAIEKPFAPDPLPWTEGGPVQDLWAVLRRRWRVIAATMALAIGGTGLYCLVVTHWYVADATVLIEPRARELMNEKQPVDEAQDAFTSAKYDYYQTQFKLLRSQTLARRVIEELGLDHDPRFMDEVPPARTPGVPVNPLIVRQYLRQLEVTPIRATRLVTVEFVSRDAQLSAAVANLHAQLFVKSGIEAVFQAMQSIRAFLEGKLTELQPRMQEAQANLSRFQSEHKMLPVDLTKDVGSERLMDLSRRHTKAEVDRITLEAQYTLVEKGDYNSVPAVLTNPLIQKLREDYNRLEVDHALLAEKFRPSYPPLQQLVGQMERAHALLEQETARVAKGLEVRYLAAQRTVQALEAELDEQRDTLVSRKDDEGDLLTLMREAETTRSLYDALLKRVKGLDVAAGATNSNISVTEPAEVPDHPSIPPTKLSLLIAFAASLMLGVGFAFLRDAADRTIQDPSDIRKTTGLDTFTVVPDFRTELPRVGRQGWHPLQRARRSAASGWERVQRLTNRRRRRRPMRLAIEPLRTPPALLLGNGHVHESAEAFRTLRTSLLLYQTNISPRVIVIASAGSTEGKTTTAVNTAAALASCGASVLLIDGDLRMPSCHTALGMDPEPGLSDYLLWELTPEPIRATHVENLSFLSAGQQVANPTELLSSWRMAKLIERTRKAFAFVVIDSAPLLAVSDGLLLAHLADGVILVTERGRTRHDHIRTALQRLHHTGAVVIGAVLNRGKVERDQFRYGSYVPDDAPRSPSPPQSPDEPDEPIAAEA